MKRLMMVATLALSGCVAGQDDSPIQFTSALALSGAPGSECVVDLTRFISRGRLNVADGGNYALAMQVRSLTAATKIQTIGSTIFTVGGETATLNEFVYTYEAPAFLGLPAEETVAIYAVIKPGSTDGYVFVNAFGPLALAKLRASGQLSDTAVGVIPTIKARGRLGTSSSFESNEFSFPVSVVNATVSCSGGGTLSSICSPGQDYFCAPKTTP